MTLKMMAMASAVAMVTFSGTAMADESPATGFNGDVTGNISVLSSYNLRGITNTPENADATLQGGLDYADASGLYAGWWTSTLDSDVYGTVNPLENNFYAGYKGAINDDLGFTVGTTYYYYYDIDTSDANGFELLLGLNYKGIGLTAQTLLEDTLWGNTGDTYFKAAYSYELPKDFSLNTALGLYFYEQSGEFIPDESTKSDFGFRHFDVGLSKALGETGATASMTYTFGGYDRMEVKQKNKVSFGLTYAF